MAAKSPDPAVGSIYGRLTVESEPVTEGRYKKLVVRCECGTVKTVEKGNLVSGRVVSCGCYIKELASHMHTTHGKRSTRIYAIWNMMNQRCTLPSNRAYKDYGGRGIKVCDRWKTFENFYEDMGDPPFTNASLERKDSNAGYDKSNVIWATKEMQANNTRKSVRYKFQGKEMTLKEVSVTAGIKYATLSSRVYGQGMSIEEAVSKPILTHAEAGSLANISESRSGRQAGYKLYKEGS
jgi:hypothetical protein